MDFHFPEYTHDYMEMGYMCPGSAIHIVNGKTILPEQETRLPQVAFLLKNTGRNVSDIAHAVGHENISYFHRIFSAEHGRSPKHYRDEQFATKDTFSEKTGPPFSVAAMLYWQKNEKRGSFLAVLLSH